MKSMTHAFIFLKSEYIKTVHIHLINKEIIVYEL